MGAAVPAAISNPIRDLKPILQSGSSKIRRQPPLQRQEGISEGIARIGRMVLACRFAPISRIKCREEGVGLEMRMHVRQIYSLRAQQRALSLRLRHAVCETR